jgi:hypothetical protein
MSIYFKPYEGKRPYIFISYSHRDSDRVLRIITGLHQKRLRLWYDEGIPAGSDWPKNIERHMRDCKAVLFFVSAAALSSPNCYSEIRTAVRSGKPVLLIPLEKAVPAEAWTDLFSHADRLPNENAAPSSDRILSWTVLKRSFYRKWTDSIRKEWFELTAVAILFVLASAGLAGLLTGRILSGTADPLPDAVFSAVQAEESAAPSESVPVPAIDPDVFPVRFPDSKQEEAIRSILGRKEGDVFRPELAAITELYFCGNQITRSMENVTFSPDGKLMVNSAEVLLSGKIEDLSLIGSMVFLERLALINQPLEDLSPLSGLVLLEELYLSGSQVSDLSQLSGLPSLQILHLEHTDVRDLTALEALPSLGSVTVSADMLPLNRPEEKHFKVILVP